MNALDWFAIIAVVIAALHGWFRGFIKETAHVLAWLIGLFVAWHLGRFLEPALGGLLASPAVRVWAARTLVVLGVLFLGAVTGTVVAHHVKPQLPEGLDGLLGTGIGALRGVLVLGVFVLMGQVLRLDGERWWQKSTLLPYGEAVADGLRVLVGEERLHRRHLVDLRYDSPPRGGPVKAA